MPKYRKVQGNYRRVLEKLNIPKLNTTFADESSYDEAIDTIFKDLQRNAFVDSNNKTFNEHITTWLGSNVSTAYSQGNINASFFSLVFQLFTLQGEKFIKDGREKVDRERYKSSKESVDLAFAYFDDKGIPCGVNISYSTINPSLWTATVIRNTIAPSDKRDVIQICHEDMLDAPKSTQLIEVDAARNTLKKALQSKSIETLLDGIISEEGKIVPEKMDPLVNTIKPKGILPAWAQNKQDKWEALKKQKNEQLKPLLTEFNNRREALKEQYAEESKKLRKERAQIQQDYTDAEIPKKIKDIKEKYAEPIKKAEEEGEKKIKEMRNPALDKVAKQSVVGRNPGAFTMGGIGFLFVLTLTLTLSGVLAPLGLALATTLAFYLAIAGTVAASAVVVGSAAKIATVETELSNYQAQLAACKKPLIDLQRQQQDEINTLNKPFSERSTKVEKQISELLLAHKEQLANLDKEIAKDKEIVKVETAFVKAAKEMLATKVDYDEPRNKKVEVIQQRNDEDDQIAAVVEEEIQPSSDFAAITTNLIEIVQPTPLVEDAKHLVDSVHSPSDAPKIKKVEEETETTTLNNDLTC